MTIPTLSPDGCLTRRSRLIESVDVVTLEPGSYSPGCAGRIEHVYLITEDGAEPLTHHNTKFTLQLNSAW